MPCQKELHWFDRGVRYETARNILYKAYEGRLRVEASRNWLYARVWDIFNYSKNQAIQNQFLLEYMLGPGSLHRVEIELQGVEKRRQRDTSASVKENPGLGKKEFRNYRKLFRFHNKPVCGEITPAYHDFSTQYIREIADFYSNTKFILIMRDPIDRYVSRCLKRIRIGSYTAEEMIEHLKARKYGKNTTERVDPCLVYDRWMEQLGESRFLALHFNELVENPSGLQKSLSEFLGLPSGMRGFRTQASFNRKAGNKSKTAVTEEQLQEIRAHANRLYAEASLKYQEKFGLTHPEKAGSTGN